MQNNEFPLEGILITGGISSPHKNIGTKSNLSGFTSHLPFPRGKGRVSLWGQHDLSSLHQTSGRDSVGKLLHGGPSSPSLRGIPEGQTDS